MDIFAQTVAARPGLAYVVGIGTPPARNSGPGTVQADEVPASVAAGPDEPEQVPGPVQDDDTEHGETGDLT